jgi:RNA polymerase sigma-70 factor (ECF subfamily)
MGIAIVVVKTVHAIHAPAVTENGAERRRLREDLIRLADGDRDAFVPVYQALWPIAQRFCARALPDSPDAEDAAQTALMKMFARASEYDPERDALSWALGIFAFECKTFRKKASRRREEMLLEGAEGASEHPLDDIIRRDLECAALDVLGTLRPSDVDVIQAMMSGERPDGATFRKRLQRALSRLRAAWGNRYGS